MALRLREPLGDLLAPGELHVAVRRQPIDAEHGADRARLDPEGRNASETTEEIIDIHSKHVINRYISLLT